MGSPLARVNVRADAWDLIWSFVHRTLVVNLGLAVANLPFLVALALVAEPWKYPVFFGLLSLSIGPALAAAFGYLSTDDPRPGLAVFVRSYRASAACSLPLWTATVALLGVLVADVIVLHDSRVGAAVVPLLVVLAVLVLTTGLTALVLLATTPDTPVRALVRLAVYACVRLWPLSLLSCAVLVAAAVIVNQAPLAGLVTVPGCALWVVLTNAKLQLARVLSRPALDR